MPSLFKIERNAPCECGSGRKYKRCCMRAVDEILSRWRRKGIWPQADLLQALALACGLKPDRDSHQLDPERVEQALASLDETFAAESDDKMVDELMKLVERLAVMLETDNELNTQLFPMHKLRPILNEMEASLEDSSEDTDLDGLFDQFGAQYLPTLVTPDVLEDMAWSLFDYLRSRDWPDTDLQSIIFGIQCCLDNKIEDNPLWMAVFTVSMQKAVRAIVDLEKLRKENGDLDMDQLEDYMEKHPLMVRDWSRRLEPELMPAIEAIIGQQITLQIPPFAVAGSLWGIAGYVHSQMTESGEDSFQAVFEQVIDEQQHNEPLMRILYETGLDLDYEIFVEHVRDVLNDWLSNEGAEFEPDVVESVSKVAATFGAELLGIQRWMLNVFYLGAVTRVLDKLPIRFRKVDPPGEAVLDIQDQQSWMDYAAYLESIGEAEGAAHVRMVCKERSQVVPFPEWDA